MDTEDPPILSDLDQHRILLEGVRPQRLAAADPLWAALSKLNRERPFRFSPAALETLGEAVDQGWKYDWRWHLSNPNLDSIRDTPRFRELEARLERETAEQLVAIRALPDMGEYDLRSSNKRSSFTK